jgi:hypothetical protein
MPVIPVNNANLTQMLQNDCQYWRSVIEWAKQRYQAYNQNCSTANMTAAGFSAEDQATILAFVADLSRFVTFAGGTMPDFAGDMVYDVQAVLGIM